jgi:hypothetical protein
LRAVAEGGRGSKVRQMGFREPPGHPVQAGGTARQTRPSAEFCYEAGPCSYGLQRLLTKASSGNSKEQGELAYKTGLGP